MSDLDALLAGIVAHPHEHVRWLVMADWLEDHGQPERAELVRVHRELLRTCTDPDAHPERQQLHARMMELMRAGVQPCLPQKTLTLPGGVELRMSFIPPGSFLMGSPETEEGRKEDETLHLVTLTKGLWLGQTPITQRQWVAVMGENPSHFKGYELPVEKVSWNDARKFCADVVKRTGMAARLPTEAEWEYACRSGTTTPYFWGIELVGGEANCDGAVPFPDVEPGQYPAITSNVGSYAARSPHPWDLIDTHGNVWEWCHDWIGSYGTLEVCDPLGAKSGSRKVFRGGSWNMSVEGCRAAYRCCRPSDFSEDNLGFRIAADLE